METVPEAAGAPVAGVGLVVAVAEAVMTSASAEDSFGGTGGNGDGRTES